ncbi:MAG: CvpA family protein [Kiritimatiellia bacterium]|jgi:uncharacterized membrane protein required for colicin V production
MPTLAWLDSLNVAASIDIAAAVLVLVFCIAGSVRGLAGECARLLALGAGVVVLRLVYPLLKTEVFTGEEVPWKILAMAGAIIAAAAIGALVHYLSKKFIRILVGQPADAIIGAALATATTLLAILVALFFLYTLPGETFHKTVFEQSITGRTAKPLIEHARERMAARAEVPFPEP